MNRYITELIGTFFLVFVIGMTVTGGTAMAPLAIGATLMVMVYMGGHVSGAHYNPAVTIALYLRGATEKGDVIPYIAAQVFGAWLAATTVQLLVGETFPVAPGVDGIAAPLLAEILATFALCLVIMNVATSKKTEGNSYYGLAIGFTVTAFAWAVGGVSGGAFNPAVGTGPILVDTMMGEGSISNLWLYWVGPVLGGLGAVPVFRFQEGASAS
ncbi:MAG: MIP/aquaporin family protein [Gemmatimonadota bacterium]